ncbi:acyltransferase family protein [Rhizobium mayense]|uniref:acyltransferase family protein n=1 Tax=Rhizobium mayense TaxID=1312184 RepID=UPI00398C6410
MVNEQVLSIPRSNSKQLDSLQFLRFVAAFSVVLFHFGRTLVLEYHVDRNYFDMGAAGVDIFFVLSGFIISYSSDPGRGLVYFARKRVARIVPLYWLLTLVIVLIALVKPNLLNSTVVTVDTVIKSLLFIPYQKSGGAVQPILFLGWTLCYEVFFYLIYGACLIFGARATWFASAAILLLIALHTIWPAGPVEWRFYTNPILIEFVLGMMLHKAYSAYSAIRSGSNVAAFVLVLLACGAYFLIVTLAGASLFASSLFAVLFVSGFLLMRLPSGKLWAILVLLGDASYSLYLVHPYTFQLPVKLLGKHLSLPVVTGILALVTLCTIGISVVLLKFFERPMQALLMRRPRPVERIAAVAE